MQKTIVEGKIAHICDICGREIDYDSRDSLSLTINQSWYNTFGFKNVEICNRHRKEVNTFIKQLKQDALNVGDKDTPNKNQLQRIKTKTDILKDALNVKEVLK